MLPLIRPSFRAIRPIRMRQRNCADAVRYGKKIRLDFTHMDYYIACLGKNKLFFVKNGKFASRVCGKMGEKRKNGGKGWNYALKNACRFVIINR